MVEFALTIGFVMLLILGMIELTLFLYTYNILADAAKEGVRYAVVHGADAATSVQSGPPVSSNCATSGAAVQGVLNQVQTYTNYSFHNPNAMTVKVCYPDGDNKPGHQVQVTVSYAYQPLFGLSWPTATVYSAAEGRIVF